MGTAKKMEKINNFHQKLDETLYQAWERFKELLKKYPQHYLTEMQEVILFNNGLEVPTIKILDSKGAIPTKTATDAKVAIQEMVEYSQKWHNETSRTRNTETSAGLAIIQAQLNNLGREIKKVNEKVYIAQVGCELCKGSHYTKDCPLKEGKTLEEAYYTQFGVPFQQGGQYRAAAPGFYQRNNANPSYQERRQSMEESLSKFMNESTKRHKENSNPIKEMQASMDTAIRNQRASVKVGNSNPINEQEKGLYGLKDLDAYSIGTTLRNESLPKKEKDPRSFTLPYIHNVCFEKALANLGASVSVMPLSTYLNLGLGKLAHTKLNVELADRIVKHPKGMAKKSTSRGNQVDDLESTIEEGEVVNEHMEIVKTRCDFIGRLDDNPSDCDFDRRIHINSAYNLRFSCMIDMNLYLDERMGDVIVGEPFCKASCVEARRFDGIITILDGNDSVTYQMVRSNPRFGIRRIHARDTAYMENMTRINTFYRIPEIGLHGFLIFCTSTTLVEYL
uniref:Eukaryotic translation initiation factor 3 subunit G N-terminal domain-containing protein n=1 Tax=Tanacetum cinerariifolium TaxID=118510 RepID=A0A6L2JPU8_TANCI|nr:hypothetical protein [Tanacetum cinerariifolium]